VIDKLLYNLFMSLEITNLVEQPKIKIDLEKIKQQCQELEFQIKASIENLEKLKRQSRKVQNLEWIKESLLEIGNELETAKQKLAKWPRGIFGLKDKKKYEDLSSKIEKLEKDLEIKQKLVHGTESELIEYDDKKSFQEIEREKQLLQEEIKKLRLDRRKIGIKLFEKPEDHSLEEALEMYGDLFFGPEEVQKVFGGDIKPEDIPPLPSKEKLERSRQLPDYLRMVLALRYEAGQKLEWKIFSSTIVRQTQGKNYIEETRGIRDFLVSNELIVQEEKEECTDDELGQISQLMKTDEAAATKRLLGLKINQNRRHKIEDMQYFVRLFRGEANDQEFTRKLGGLSSEQRILDDSFESTKSFLENEKGLLVKRVGKFTESRAGGYVIETVKPSLNETEGWGTSYNTGVRVII